MSRTTRELRILSAGAPKEGVRLCAEAWSEATGTPFVIEFATAPVIRERVSCGADHPDVVIAPRRLVQTFQADGSVIEGTVVTLGSVSTGVAVRTGSPEPDLSSVDTFRAALLNADQLIFNTATSGAHIADVIAQFGLTDALADKTVRTHTGADVLEQLAAGDRSNALGFGQITEIKRKEELGIRLVGPLPGDLGKVTPYDAALLSGAGNAPSAVGMLNFLSTKAAQRILGESGLALNDRL